MIYTEHGYEELYNTRDDPHETTNFASDKKYAGVLNTFRKRYAILKQSVK